MRQLTLDSVPELAALVEGLRGTLSGNGALLGGGGKSMGGALGGAVLGAILPLGIRGRKTLRPLFNALGIFCIAATVASFVLLVLSWVNGY